MRETKPGDFNIITVPPRLNRKGDMFAGVNTERQRIDEPWRRLNSNFRPRQ
jgi:DNA primase